MRRGHTRDFGSCPGLRLPVLVHEVCDTFHSLRPIYFPRASLFPSTNGNGTKLAASLSVKLCEIRQADKNFDILPQFNATNGFHFCLPHAAAAGTKPVLDNARKRQGHLFRETSSLSGRRRTAAACDISFTQPDRFLNRSFYQPPREKMNEKKTIATRVTTNCSKGNTFKTPIKQVEKLRSRHHQRFLVPDQTYPAPKHPSACTAPQPLKVDWFLSPRPIQPCAEPLQPSPGTILSNPVWPTKHFCGTLRHQSAEALLFSGNGWSWTRPPPSPVPSAPLPPAHARPLNFNAREPRAGRTGVSTNGRHSPL